MAVVLQDGFFVPEVVVRAVEELVERQAKPIQTAAVRPHFAHGVEGVEYLEMLAVNLQTCRCSGARSGG